MFPKLGTLNLSAKKITCLAICKLQSMWSLFYMGMKKADRYSAEYMPISFRDQRCSYEKATKWALRISEKAINTYCIDVLYFRPLPSWYSFEIKGGGGDFVWIEGARSFLGCGVPTREFIHYIPIEFYLESFEANTEGIFDENWVRKCEIVDKCWSDLQSGLGYSLNLNAGPCRLHYDLNDWISRGPIQENLWATGFNCRSASPGYNSLKADLSEGKLILFA